jgi:hypothetical protein
LTLDIMYRRIAELNPDPANPRRHTKKQIRQIADSIKTFGFNVPILVGRDGPADAVEGLERLAVGVQRFVPPTTEGSRPPDRLDLVRLVGFGDGREAHHVPRLLRKVFAVSQLCTIRSKRSGSSFSR